MKAMSVIGGLGKALMAIGILILLFVAYQLWGTGIHEAQAQKSLGNELDEKLAAAETTTTAPSSPDSTAPPETAPSVDLVPEIGEPVGRIEIPELNVKKTFVQGDSLTQLDRAPGHYPATPFPGQKGNAAIAGHRTTYGAPFFHVDKLSAGDEIIITTVQGTFTYSVTDVFIVNPEDVWVLDDDPDEPNLLTLTACHPRYSLKERIIVRAVLDGTPVSELPGQREAAKEHSTTVLADGIDTDGGASSILTVVFWGFVCIAIWFGAWLAVKLWRTGAAEQRRYRTVIPYAIGLPIFAVTLFVFYGHLAQVLPAGL